MVDIHGVWVTVTMEDILIIIGGISGGHTMEDIMACHTIHIAGRFIIIVLIIIVHLKENMNNMKVFHLQIQAEAVELLPLNHEVKKIRMILTIDQKFLLQLML